MEPVGFNRGFYTVDVRYFYRITADAFVGTTRPVAISGLAVFDKRAILFGSEGSARCSPPRPSWTARTSRTWGKNNLPIAVVESVDPLILGMKLSDSCQCQCDCCDSCDGSDIPDAISACFCRGAELLRPGQAGVRHPGPNFPSSVWRDSQLLIPAMTTASPARSAPTAARRTPCAIFRKVQFPMEEFFLPNTLSQPEGYQETKSCCPKGMTALRPSAKAPGGPAMTAGAFHVSSYAHRCWRSEAAFTRRNPP